MYRDETYKDAYKSLIKVYGIDMIELALKKGYIPLLEAYFMEDDTDIIDMIFRAIRKYYKESFIGLLKSVPDLRTDAVIMRKIIKKAVNYGNNDILKELLIFAPETLNAILEYTLEARRYENILAIPLNHTLTYDEIKNAIIGVSRNEELHYKQILIHLFKLIKNMENFLSYVVENDYYIVLTIIIRYLNTDQLPYDNLFKIAIDNNSIESLLILAEYFPEEITEEIFEYSQDGSDKIFRIIMNHAPKNIYTKEILGNLTKRRLNIIANKYNVRPDMNKNTLIKNIIKELYEFDLT